MTQSASDHTKTAINELTTATHKSRNNYSYKYSDITGRYYHCNVGNNDNEVILEEDQPNQPPETYLLGYASNKKEFVDLVYENLHPNRI